MNNIRLQVLLVDDDKNIRQTLLVSLKGLDCDVTAATSVEDAIVTLKSRSFDFILTDYRLEKSTGIDLIKFAKRLRPVPISAVMTAYASFDNAVEAIKEGAYDYLPKPFTAAQLEYLLKKVRTLIELKRENEKLKADSDKFDFFEGMTSPAMNRLREFVGRVSSSDATILMIGESGTGKTELAKHIHRHSDRRDSPFIVVNCTSLAESLLESELFGHVKGAYTGATQDRIGKFELAKGGTLFIDEIGELSAGGQSKLLRFLQEKIIERVGGNQSIAIDTRVIAATNRDLGEAVKAGKFREDLYYRLNVFECHLVGLRYRIEDLPVLMERFKREFSMSAHKEDLDIPKELLGHLHNDSWPGNVRELRNTIERLVYLSPGKELSFTDLPESINQPARDNLDRPATLEEIERKHISEVLKSETNQEKAAEILGITTVTLWRKRKQYGLP